MAAFYHRHGACEGTLVVPYQEPAPSPEPARLRLVIIESPLAGDVEANTAYARRCMLDCLRRNEAPYASHLLFPQVLDDLVPAERALGIEAGLAWGAKADATVVYTDRGISNGMRMGIARAERAGRPVEMRTLGGVE